MDEQYPYDYRLYEKFRRNLRQSLSYFLHYIELYAQKYLRTPEKTPKPEDVAEILTIDHQLAVDKIDLIFDEMLSKQDITIRNLDMLERCLLIVDNWRNELARPQKYERGHTWMGLNQMEMNIRLRIIDEWGRLRDSLAFPQRDLRDALLENKLLSKEARMMDLGLEGMVDGFDN